MGFRPGLKGSLEEILEAGKNQLHHQPPVNKPDAPVQFCKPTRSLILHAAGSTLLPGCLYFASTILIL